ncbi:hypothetical protein [Rhizobium halophilum]|uniref:hypothetical protein n=1 Tax=Rhizobium halophilum TaxID=2846852 RepID=UPI001EFE8A08|nr:hypothetical protein [Rhizobium halophilum]MCF6368137.1 hypothetical protein [Rhizobium halophilum]
MSSRVGALRGEGRLIARCEPDDEAFDSDGFDAADDSADEPDEDERISWPPERIRFGFARRLLDA